MNNLENLILKALEQLNKLNSEQISNLVEIKEANSKSLLSILINEHIVDEETFFDVLSDIYRRGNADIDDISTDLQVDQ